MTDRWKLYLIPWLGFVLALGMHLWHLGQPSTLIGDEVFFVNDGQDYVLGQHYFDPHPPLGKEQLGAVFTYAGFTPVTWRILNAIEGALIIPLVWWLVWKLSRRARAAHLAAGLMLLDGFLLLDSRLGLINVPYILYALVAVAAILKSLEGRRVAEWLMLSGLFFGAAISVKWLAGALVVPAIIIWCWPQYFGLQRVQARRWGHWLLAACAWLIIPAAMYATVFAIHFAWLGLPSNFWGLHSQMLEYQLRVPATGDPYGAPWWGWLIMWQPALYWFHVVGAKTQTMWSLPNPWIWWTGSIAVVWSMIRGWRDYPTRTLNIFLLATWIPFAFIHRIMYSYHAIPFGIFSMMLLATYLDRWWELRKKIVISYFVIAVVVFAWFLPWWYGWSLSSTQQHLRRWLPGWSIRPGTAGTVSATPRPAIE